MHLHSPASRDDAFTLILSTQPTFDTAGTRDLFARASLDRLFDSGQRTPARIWQALEGDRPLGMLGARVIGEVALIDMIALPVDDAAADLLISTATAWARALPEAEAGFETPAAERPLDDPLTARTVERFAVAGWRLLVTRHHYHLSPAVLEDAPALELPPTVRLERAQEGDQPRLGALLERMLVGSFDVRDRQSVAELGLTRAAERMLAELVESDPIDCVRFAVDGDDDAGLVSYRLMPDGRAFILQVGVAASHRGRGLAAALVSVATRDLLAAGATTLIADTDDVNLPMARSFARAGWHPTAVRVDLVLD